jgi:hypothetical protein
MSQKLGTVLNNREKNYQYKLGGAGTVSAHSNRNFRKLDFLRFSQKACRNDKKLLDISAEFREKTGSFI